VKEIIVKFNMKTYQAIVLMIDHEAVKKFNLLPDGTWKELAEGEKQQTVEKTLIYGVDQEEE